MQIIRIEPKSNSLEDLQEYIAKCASVVRDKDPKSAEKLWDRLLTESVSGTASRVLEYIPCTVPCDSDDRVIQILNEPFKQTINSSQLFGFFTEDGYYTNARELLNWGYSIEHILQLVDFTHYRVFQCETPYFLYGQISTHNQLTTVSHSQRYANCDRGYWKPNELDTWANSWANEAKAQTAYNSIVEATPPNELRDWFKGLGVVRKEVFDRGADMLQNRVFTIGGYTNNPNSWEHFIKQRLDKHTQLETREFTKMLNLDLKFDN